MAIQEHFQKSEIFGLTSQIQRAAVAIPSNIAEGKKRKTVKDFLQFLHIADGSAAELETQFLLSKKLYPSDKLDEMFHILEEVQKMLTVMIRKLDQ
jgi:four helix bundle protein